MKEHKVFVYGTLKRGFGNNILLKDSEFLCQTTTKDSVFTMHSRGIPFVDTGGKHKVSGELWHVDADTLRSLDGLEGHPTWYVRKEIELDSGDVAWMYHYPHDKHCDQVEPDEEGVVRYGF